MSTNKKYFYLKLKDNFYDQENIKILESMQNGYEYSSLYLKLCLLSINEDGKLIFKGRIPYNAEMLSAITGHKIDTIKVAISVFCELELIKILDNGVIFLEDVQNLVGRGSSEAERKALYRQKIAKESNEIEALESGTMSQDSSTRDKRLEIRVKSLEIRDIENRDLKDKNIRDFSNEKSVNIPYEEIRKKYNEICDLEQLRELSEKKKEKIRIRWKEGLNSVEKWIEVFKKISESEFLHGINDRKWKASFDWIIKNDDNFQKILSGKYDSEIDPLRGRRYSAGKLAEVKKNDNPF